MIKGNCIVAQSGGPTAVINASACGAILEAFAQENIEKVYGAKNGIVGVLKEEFFDMEAEDTVEIQYLITTPSSGLGSCRYRLKEYQKDPSDYIRIFEVFQAHNIRYFFYIGGNDSMDTIKKVSEYAKIIGYELYAVGIPKTIDNDLMGTDHCPGFGSTAKYIATSVMEATKDAEVYATDIITILEVMGRNAGWIAAASALGNPDLIYLPEVPFSFEKFEKDVRDVYSKKGKVLIVVSEGIADAEGTYVAQMETKQSDGFGHAQLGGVGTKLGHFIKHHIQKRVKVIEFGILQRCAMHFASKTDVDEAFQIGQSAVKYGINGYTGFMTGIKRLSNAPYQWEPELVDLQKAANSEKRIPKEWITADGNYVTEECIAYIRPLIMGEVDLPIENGLPRYAKLKKQILPKKLETSYDLILE